MRVFQNFALCLLQEIGLNFFELRIVLSCAQKILNLDSIYADQLVFVYQEISPMNTDRKIIDI